MANMLITGGGRGLGRATAARLARAGHRILLTARTQADAESAARALRDEVPGAQVEPLHAALDSLAAVRQLADDVAAKVGALDVLFNIAGVMQTNPERQCSRDGFELTLAVNALAPFLLTRLLLPSLRRAPRGRVVNVSSRLHLPGSRGAPVDFDFDDPNLERGYNPDRAYKNSKLALLWVTYEQQRRLGDGGVTVNAVCPGFVPLTAAASSRKPFERFLMRHLLPHFKFATTVDAASDALAFMATDPSVGARGGRFFGEKHEIASSPESHEVEKARRFWALASRWVGLDPDEP